jgi:hypothetical protein
LIHPGIPQAGKGDRLLICPVDVVRLLLVSLLVPFVEATCGYDASLGFEWVSEEGLLCEGFYASIEG